MAPLALALWFLQHQGGKCLAQKDHPLLVSKLKNAFKHWSKRSDDDPLKRLKAALRDIRVSKDGLTSGQELSVTLEDKDQQSNDVLQAIAKSIPIDLTTLECGIAALSPAQSFNRTRTQPFGLHDAFVSDLADKAQSSGLGIPKHLTWRTIFLIGGAFGDTKSILHAYFETRSERQWTAVVPKLTCAVQANARVRRDLSPDLIHVTPEAFDHLKNAFGPQRFFFYVHGGQKYGIVKDWIVESLRRALSVLLICHVPAVARQLAEHFGMFRQVKAWVYIENLREQLARYCEDQEAEMAWRMERAAAAWDDFKRESMGYSVLFYDGHDRHQFESQLDSLFQIARRHRSREYVTSHGDVYYLPRGLASNVISGIEQDVADRYSQNVFVIIDGDCSSGLIRQAVSDCIRAEGLEPVLAANAAELSSNHEVISPLAVSYHCRFALAVFGAETSSDDSGHVNDSTALYQLGFLSGIERTYAVFVHASARRSNVKPRHVIEFNCLQTLRDSIRTYLRKCKQEQPSTECVT